MSKLQRVNSFIFGVLMLIMAAFMLEFRDSSYMFILFFLGMGYFITGIGRLIYFFTMARYMVGGKVSLYRAVILIDFAVLTLSLADVPKIYILLYLAVINVFAGIVEVLRANETRVNGSKNFKLKLFHGIFNIVIAVCCIVFLKYPHTAVIIYCIGLVYSAIIRIVTAFRRSTFVYIS
jgi:uncharacterized membrane protein HdeD (DUF308 family)